MFLAPLSLQQISQLRNPNERVPLSEHLVYKDALQLVENGDFEGARVLAIDTLKIEFFGMTVPFRESQK